MRADNAIRVYRRARPSRVWLDQEADHINVHNRDFFQIQGDFGPQLLSC